MYPWGWGRLMPNFCPIWFSVLPPGGEMQKHKKCNNSLNIDRSLLKFLWYVPLVRGHHIYNGFLNWPTFQGHRGQSFKKFERQHVLRLMKLQRWNLVWICTVALGIHVHNFSSFRLQIWPPGGHLENSTFAPTSWMVRVMMLQPYTYVYEGT